MFSQIAIFRFSEIINNNQSQLRGKYIHRYYLQKWVTILPLCVDGTTDFKLLHAMPGWIPHNVSKSVLISQFTTFFETLPYR